MRTIAEADHGRANNFNLLRMVAAGAVLVSHAWALTLGRAVPEPLLDATGYSLGIAAVVVFFAVSGYFITKSFDRRTLLADFAAARVCRIFPGLIVALCLTAFALGPVFTELPVSRYLAQPGTWIYAPQNTLLVHQRFALPGVFARNPFAGVANGSLWTLKYEVGCYVSVVAAGYARLLRPAAFPLVLFAAVAALAVVPGGNMGMAARLAVLCGAFAFGAGAYVYRTKVPLSVWPVLVLALLAVATREMRVYPLFYATSLAYGALVCGFADLPWLRGYNRLGDYSYGLYIYAFPLGQALVALVPGIGPGPLIAITLPAALLAGMVSWRLVESPALVHRHRLAALARRGGGGR